MASRSPVLRPWPCAARLATAAPGRGWQRGWAGAAVPSPSAEARRAQWALVEVGRTAGRRPPGAPRAAGGRHLTPARERRGSCPCHQCWMRGPSAEASPGRGAPQGGEVAVGGPPEGHGVAGSAAPAGARPGALQPGRGGVPNPLLRPGALGPPAARVAPAAAPRGPRCCLPGGSAAPGPEPARPRGASGGRRPGRRAAGGREGGRRREGAGGGDPAEEAERGSATATEGGSAAGSGRAGRRRGRRREQRTSRDAAPRQQGEPGRPTRRATR